jgi:hypothetical protein
MIIESGVQAEEEDSVDAAAGTASIDNAEPAQAEEELP